jgi:hypothetical protein
MLFGKPCKFDLGSESASKLPDFECVQVKEGVAVGALLEPCVCRQQVLHSIHLFYWLFFPWPSSSSSSS